MFSIETEKEVIDHVQGLEIKSLFIENHSVVISLHDGSNLIIRQGYTHSGLDVYVAAD